MMFFWGFVAAAALLGFAGWLKSGAESAHVHDWRVTGAQQMYSVPCYSGIQIQKAEEGEPITVVLYWCKDCFETATEDLDGHWTVAQLSGEELKPEKTDA